MLARGAKAISQDGMVYDDSNINALLLARHTAKKSGMAAGGSGGIPNAPLGRTRRLKRPFPADRPGISGLHITVT